MQKDLLEVSRSANIDLIPSQLTVSDKRFNPPEHNAQFNAKANQAQGNNKKRRERRRPTGNNSDKDKRLKRRSTAHEEQPKKKEKKKEKIYCSANAKKSLPFQEDPKRKEG